MPQAARSQNLQLPDRNEGDGNKRRFRVRYRLDGTLQEIMKPPMKMKAAITSRVKILSDLNIAERRLPQDGRIKLKMKNKVVDFRVSTLPTIFGEKIVMRILDK